MIICNFLYETPLAQINESKMKKSLKDDKIALGAGLGITFGIIFGVVIDNVGLGIALGIALGAGIGYTQQKKTK